MASLHAFRKYLTRGDALLAAAAVLGLALYVLLLPGQHPDAAARFDPGAGEAQQAAEAFLAARGYAVEGLAAEVQLRRHPKLLNALQAALGRPETRALLAEAEARRELPAYYWRVRYEDDLSAPEARAPGYDVLVTLEGAVWDFERPVFPDWMVSAGQRSPSRRAAERRIERTALSSVFRLAADTLGGLGALDLRTLSDSLLWARLAFEATDTTWATDPAGMAVAPEAARLRTRLDGANPLGFGAEVAVALARYQLAQTAWPADAFRADSVWLLPEREARQARVRFVRTAPLYSQQVRVDVTVAATGALHQLDATLEPVAPPPSETLRTVAGVLQIGLYALLILVLVIAFFRRFAARLIDGRAALVDGAVLGLSAVILLVVMRDITFTNEDASVWRQLLGAVFALLMVGGIMAVFTIIMAGTADSLARNEWPRKLRTASLVRLGDFRNVYVGRSLLRGICVAFVLLGLTVVFLWLAPGAALYFDDFSESFLPEHTYQPMLWASVFAGISAYFVLTFVLLGLGTYIYHLSKKAQAKLVVAAVTLALVLMQGAWVELEPVGYRWVLSGLWGVVLAVTFWKTSFLTTFVGYFVALLCWFLKEGWLVEGSPVWMDVLLSGMLVLGLLGLGLFALVSGRSRRQIGEYVPSYISEITQQERLKRELEIARIVQTSFLPRRMPDVEGLDIAAMCLAALEVGGDYYDFIKLGPRRLAVVIGDVSGKGTQAAFFMTLTKGFVQTLSREDLPPAQVLRRLNLLFCENAPRGTFISMIYGVFDVDEQTFTFARAGHNPVILNRAPGDAADLLQPAGMGIGLVMGETFDETIEEVTLDLRAGDVLVFYTDGFSEAMNRAKDLYGDDRLARRVSEVGPRSANEILRAVSEDVHHFVEAAGRHDDMTMVVVKMLRRTNHVPAQSEVERWKVES